MGTGELLGQPDRMPGRGATCGGHPIHPEGSSNTLSLFMLQKLELSAGSYEPIGLKRLYYLHTQMGRASQSRHWVGTGITASQKRFPISYLIEI